jgi:hypothetical protein
VKPNSFGSQSNSGVLALDTVRNLGATSVVLLGFDMHGTHFFGQYTNGCGNTTVQRREVHHRQYRQWAQRNKSIEVLNCTKGSALDCFPMRELDAVLDS